MKLFVSDSVSELIKGAIDISPLPLKPYDCLDAPVSSHADMLVFVLENRIFCYADYYLVNKDIFDIAENEGYKIVPVSKKCQKNYPYDISLNALVMGKVIFANLKYIAKEIINYAQEEGFSFVNVKQGYSACSTLVLDDNNAITADKGMYNAISLAGKNATLISKEGIILNGYDHGFIGGASFVIGDTVFFFGDIKTHPDYQMIHSKINELDMKEFCILRGDVFDFGGGKII